MTEYYKINNKYDKINRVLDIHFQYKLYWIIINKMEILLKRNQTRKLLILVAFVFLSIIYLVIYNHGYQTFINGQGENSVKQSSLIFFYNLHRGMDFGYFQLFVLLCFPLITGYNTFNSSVMKFDEYEIIRIGYSKYYVNQVIKAINDIWFFPLVINVVFISLLFVFGFELFGDRTLSLFTSSDLFDLFIFILLQTIGWCILNVFCVVLSQIITNKYLYGLSLLLYSIAITLVSVFLLLPLENVYVPIFGSLHYTLVYMLSPFTLLTVGTFSIIGVIDQLLMIVILSILFYIILCAILLRIVIIKRRKIGHVF